MRLGRQLARMLPAMIVMIVAYLAPSLAEAHPGHRHLPPAAGSASEAMPASRAIAAPSQAVAMASVLYQEAAVFVSVADFDGPGPLNRCTGPCCCYVSMSCYAHALTADAGGVALMEPAGRLIAIPDELAHPGADPEALPKPPRTFA